MGSSGRSWLITQRGTRAGVPALSLSTPWALTGEQTKALVTQLTLFNQILVELRDDIRDQVRAGAPAKGGAGLRGAAEAESRLLPVFLSTRQVKEMSLIRNTIMECQVCGEWERSGGLRWHRCASPPPMALASASGDLNGDLLVALTVPSPRLPRAAFPLQPQPLLPRRGLHGSVRVPGLPLWALPSRPAGQRHPLH